MVCLTMTPSFIEGLQKIDNVHELVNDGEPTLDEARIGNPVSHGQIIGLAKGLKASGHDNYTLEKLLRGAKVYVAPPPPKPEPSDEYKALMARLRREEEERVYERMVNPPPAAETFSQRYPNAAMTHAFAEVNRARQSDLGDDDVTYNDVHRQLMLILNFLVTIIGCAASLWILARWWSTPARLFFTMGGSALVGVAEVAVYNFYIWHLSEAKRGDKSLKEVKEIASTWVVGSAEKDSRDIKELHPVPTSVSEDAPVRRRRKADC